MQAMISAADLHNVGNSNESFWSAPVDNTMEFTRNTMYAAVATAISGANGLYNSGAQIGNFFGADIEVNNAHAWMSKIDSDLDAYYMQHQEGIDVAGFVLGSFVPGMAGVKVLNAGQRAVRGALAGMGGNTARIASGVLTPSLDVYRFSAAADIARGTAKFSALNANVLKAVGAGFGQNAMEAAVFELAAVGTGFASPVLEGKEASDIAKDMIVNTLFGGAVGGLFSAAKTFYGVKRATSAVDRAVNARYEIPEFVKLSDGEQAVNFSTQLRDLPLPPSVDDILLGKVPGLETVIKPLKSVNEASGQEIAAATQFQAKFVESRARVADQLRDALSGKVVSLASGDSEISRLFTNGMNTSIAGADGLLDAVAIKRLGQVGETVTRKNKLRQGAEYDEFVELFGDAAGTTSNVKPNLWRVADVEGSVEAVAKYVKGKAFDVMNSVKYSEFKAIDELTADARNIWTRSLSEIPKDVIIDVSDVPLLKRALELNTNVNVRFADGVVDTVPASRLFGEIRASVADLKTKALTAINAGADDAISLEQLAHRLDVNPAYLEGTLSANVTNDIFHSRAVSEAYTDNLIKTFVTPEGTSTIDTGVLPRFAAITNKQRAASEYADIGTDFVVKAQASVLARAKIAQNVTRSKLVDVLGDELEQYAPLDAKGISRYGAGGGFFTKPNEGYLSAGSVAQHAGLVTERGIARVTDEVRTAMLPDAHAVRIGHMSADEQLVGAVVAPAAEVSAVLNRAQRAGEQYVPFTLPSGEQGFALRSVLRQAEKEGITDLTREALEDVATRINLRRVGADTFFEVQSDTAYKFLSTHIAESDKWLRKQISLDASRGLDSVERYSDLMGGLYVPKPNTSRFPYFAFVTDTRLGAGAAGRTTMIHAPNQKALTELMDRVRAETGFTVRTRDEAERFYKGQGTFDYEQTMTHSYVDQELVSRGIMSQHFVQTNPDAVVDDIMAFHTSRAAQQYREGVHSLYADAFEQVRKIEQPYTDAARSTNTANQPSKVSGPGEDLIRIATGLPKGHAMWNGFDDALNKAARGMIDTIGKLAAGAKTPADLEQINKVLEQHGVSTVYKDAATHALINHPAGVRPVTAFIRTANAALSTLALGWDALNAVNNAVGSTILRSAELKYVLDSVRAVNPEAVGKLAELKAAGVSMLSPAKIQAKAYAEFLTMGRDHPWYAEFKSAGYVREVHDVQMALLDSATLVGTESVKELEARMLNMTSLSSKLVEAGRTITGNNYAERMNRFVSAHSAKQITELGIAAGVIDAKEARTIIATFVNRTEGTLVSSQRPTVFTGAVGSAIGLFQSYQFNMAQQLLRYVGEGGTKATAYTLGMQGAIYGMNGLPGFQQLNQHIIGTLSTNPQHKDLYDQTYGAAGKDAGDLLLYGIPSNILQTNLYSRGDISPRHLTILPTNLADIPVVGMMTKAVGAIASVATEMGDTGNITHALLTGLEENGVNRPLAGIATLTKGLVYQDGVVQATSRAGVVNMTSELWSLSQLSRFAGGRPLDEAAAIDGMFRIKSFTKKDTERKAAMTESLRNAMAAGDVGQAQLEDALHWFASQGKGQREFGQWVMETQKGMTEDAVTKVATNLKSPYGYKMQRILGGGE